MQTDDIVLLVIQDQLVQQTQKQLEREAHFATEDALGKAAVELRKKDAKIDSLASEIEDLKTGTCSFEANDCVRSYCCLVTSTVETLREEIDVLRQREIEFTRSEVEIGKLKRRLTEWEEMKQKLKVRSQYRPTDCSADGR